MENIQLYWSHGEVQAEISSDKTIPYKRDQWSHHSRPKRPLIRDYRPSKFIVRSKPPLIRQSSIEVISVLLFQPQFIALNCVDGMQAATVMICALDQFVAIVKPLYYNCFKVTKNERLLSNLLIFDAINHFWVVLILNDYNWFLSPPTFVERWFERSRPVKAYVVYRTVLVILLRCEVFIFWF